MVTLPARGLTLILMANATGGKLTRRQWRRHTVAICGLSCGLFVRYAFRWLAVALGCCVSPRGSRWQWTFIGLPSRTTHSSTRKAIDQNAVVGVSCVLGEILVLSYLDSTDFSTGVTD